MKKYTEVKARNAFNKILNNVARVYGLTKMAIVNAWENENGDAIATDGYRIIRLHHSIPAGTREVWTCRDVSAADRALFKKSRCLFESFLDAEIAKDYTPLPALTPEEIRARTDALGRCKFLNGARPLYFDAVFLSELATVFPQGRWFTLKDRNLSPLIVIDSDGEALLEPIRVM